MSSKNKSKKAESNRKNAQKSTGPKTPKGKATASQNAVKHGLYAKAVVLNSPNLTENKQDYLELVQSLFDDLKPEGRFQEDLVYKIANCIWRSKRVVAAETARIEYQLDDVDADDYRRDRLLFYTYDNDDPEDMAELDQYVQRQVGLHTGMKSIPNNDWSRLIQRYEMRLERQMTRCFKLLKELKRMGAEKAVSEHNAPALSPASLQTRRLEWQDLPRDAGDSVEQGACPTDHPHGDALFSAPDKKELEGVSSPDDQNTKAENEAKYPFDLSDIPLAEPPYDTDEMRREMIANSKYGKTKPNGRNQNGDMNM